MKRECWLNSFYHGAGIRDVCDLSSLRYRSGKLESAPPWLLSQVEKVAHVILTRAFPTTMIDEFEDDEAMVEAERPALQAAREMAGQRLLFARVDCSSSGGSPICQVTAFRL